jgi:hypothetical protein
MKCFWNFVMKKTVIFNLSFNEVALIKSGWKINPPNIFSLCSISLSISIVWLGAIHIKLPSCLLLFCHIWCCFTIVFKHNWIKICADFRILIYLFTYLAKIQTATNGWLFPKLNNLCKSAMLWSCIISLIFFKLILVNIQYMMPSSFRKKKKSKLQY